MKVLVAGGLLSRIALVLPLHVNVFETLISLVSCFDCVYGCEDVMRQELVAVECTRQILI